MCQIKYHHVGSFLLIFFCNCLRLLVAKYLVDVWSIFVWNDTIVIYF